MPSGHIRPSPRRENTVFILIQSNDDGVEDDDDNPEYTNNGRLIEMGRQADRYRKRERAAYIWQERGR